MGACAERIIPFLPESCQIQRMSGFQGFSGPFWGFLQIEWFEQEVHPHPQLSIHFPIRSLSSPIVIFSDRNLLRSQSSSIAIFFDRYLLRSQSSLTVIFCGRYSRDTRLGRRTNDLRPCCCCSCVRRSGVHRHKKTGAQNRDLHLPRRALHQCFALRPGRTRRRGCGWVLQKHADRGFVRSA